MIGKILIFDDKDRRYLQNLSASNLALHYGIYSSSSYATWENEFKLLIDSTFYQINPQKTSIILKEEKSLKNPHEWDVILIKDTGFMKDMDMHVLVNDLTNLNLKVVNLRFLSSKEIIENIELLSEIWSKKHEKESLV